MAEHVLQIPVQWNGKEYEFTAQVQQWQYGWRFVFDIEGVRVNFEKDDNGEWRAVINYDDATGGKTVDKELVEKLGKVIREVTG
jgi:hypothetical protein